MRRYELKGADWIDSKEKRLFDVSAATIMTPLTLPIATVGMMAFALETRLNPVFIQERVGRAEALLMIFKLRTMASPDDYADRSDGFSDKRASRVGRQLRRLTIDESPQLLQVLAGQMSIVGPRPLVRSEVEATMDILSPTEQAMWRQARTITKPGLFSDYGNGSRTMGLSGDDALRARVDMDVQYAKTASFDTDNRIIKEALRIGKTEVGNQHRVIGGKEG